MKVDWIAKAQHLLQTLAFCLAVSAIQFAFQPERPYEIALVYSLCIGTSIWLLIDFGRHLFASAAQTGWPTGHAAWLLPLGSVIGGYLLGGRAADGWFGWSSWSGGGLSTLPASLLITGLAGAAASYYFYTKSQSGYLRTRVAQASFQASQARLRLLESQLEPHMLFNTLANLQVLIDTDPARAHAMLDHLIAYLRATLRASRTGTHSLDMEFARLRDYLELMAIRMGPRLSFVLTRPPELASVPVPTLLLQPLVENAIRHGLEPKVEGGSITVRARHDGSSLVLQVDDTGVGMPTGRHADAGFGLTQVRERLRTMYGTQAELALLRDRPQGLGVRIRLPAEADGLTGPDLPGRDGPTSTKPR